MHFVTWSQVKICFPIFSMIFHDRSSPVRLSSFLGQTCQRRRVWWSHIAPRRWDFWRWWRTCWERPQNVGKMWGKCWENVGKMLGKCWENVGKMGECAWFWSFFYIFPLKWHFFWLGLGNKAIASCMSVEGGYQYYDGCKNRDPVLRKNSDSKQQLIIIDLRSTHCHGLMTATAECRGLWLFGWMSEKQR